MFSPVNIEKIILDQGVELDEFPFETMNWCVFKRGETYIIVTSTYLDEIDKRMTQAHELAHIEDDSINTGYTPLAERRAYKFARRILIPSRALRKFIEEEITDVFLLAWYFKVSEKMIRLRCAELFS